jgi:ParB-like chromosome segregation protein Spo0J
MTLPRIVAVPDNWPIDNLHPYENNAKIHTPEQVRAIAASLARFGMDQPIVVDGSGVIIKGHGRWLAAKSLGMTSVPVIVRTDMTRNEAAASRLADNRVAEGDTDTMKLQIEVKELADADFDLDSLGFNDQELRMLTEDLGAMDDDAIMHDAGEVETSVSSVDRDTATLAEKEVPLVKIFKSSKVPGQDAPLLSDFMNDVEAETGKEGVEALIAWVKALREQQEVAS